MRGLAAMSAPKCAGAAMSRALLYPTPGWPAPSVACVMLSGEEPLERSLPNLVVDFSGPLLLQDRMTVHLQSVIGAADSQTLSDELVRALLESGEELVRDVLPRSDSDSECDAPSGYCWDLGHLLHIEDPPLRRCCIQIVHVADDLGFLRVPLRSHVGVGNVEFLQVGRHQDWMVENIATVHVPQVRQSSIFLQRVPWLVGSSEVFWTHLREIGGFLLSGRVICRRSTSAGSPTQLHGSLPVAWWAAARPRVSAATVPRARLHSRGPSTFLGIGASSSC